MPLYFSLIFAISGCSAAIFFIDFMLASRSGSMHEVDDDRHQDDRPAVVVRDAVVHLVHAPGTAAWR